LLLFVFVHFVVVVVVVDDADVLELPLPALSNDGSAYATAAGEAAAVSYKPLSSGSPEGH